MEVRAATGPEVEAARVLTDRSWLATYAPLIGEAATRAIVAERHAAEVFARQAAANLFLVALDGGTVVGHAHAMPKDGHYLDRLHVEPGLKGRGIGRTLMAAVEAAREPRQRFWLDVLEGNDAALGFYARLGFREVARTEACGGLAGIPAVVMEKD